LLDHVPLPRNPTGASIGAMKLNFILLPPLAEVQSFIVDIYKEIGIDGSKSILATASSMTIMLQKGTTLALASRTTTRATTTRPSTKNHANSTIPVNVDFESVQASKLNLNTFNFNKLGAQWSLLGSQKTKSWVTSNIMEAITKAGTKDQQDLALRKACPHPSIVELTKTAGLAPTSTLEERHNLVLEQMKKTLKEVLGDGKRKWVNMDQLTFAEILSSSLMGSGATVGEMLHLLELDLRSFHQLFLSLEKKNELASCCLRPWFASYIMICFSL
jgi:hypothetical protein